MHGLLPIFTLLVALCLAIPGQAFEGKVYKWKDHNGKIHFSDKPPQDESIKVEEQKIDHSKLTVTSMPLSQKLTPLSEEQCSEAMDNFNTAEPQFLKELDEKLSKKQITDQEFSQALLKLDHLKSIIKPDACKNAQPKDRGLLNCLAQNSNAKSCLQ